MEKFLREISTYLQDVMEKTFSNYPSGICYLTGHVMTEVLTKLGHDAFEVSGTFVLKTKSMKNIVYGDRKIKGFNVGDYHTWCELETEEDVFIIDPSLKYNKVTIKKQFSQKVHPNVPGVVITKFDENNLFTYIEDESLVKESKKYLNGIPSELIKELVDKTTELAKKIV